MSNTFVFTNEQKDKFLKAVTGYNSINEDLGYPLEGVFERYKSLKEENKDFQNKLINCNDKLSKQKVVAESIPEKQPIVPEIRSVAPKSNKQEINPMLALLDSYNTQIKEITEYIEKNLSNKSEAELTQYKATVKDIKKLRDKLLEKLNKMGVKYDSNKTGTWNESDFSFGKRKRQGGRKDNIKSIKKIIRFLKKK